MKRILVPTDFSAASKESLKFAMDLASNGGGDVFVVHINELPIAPETTLGIQPYAPDPEALQGVKEAEKKVFETMKKGLDPTIEIHFETINDYIVPGMREYVGNNNIDLIVMSTHGTSDPGEISIGSTAEKIARFSPVPVIFIEGATNAKPERPNEIPQPGKDPETLPSEEPAPNRWPRKEPEIKPEKEPLTIPPTAPPEVPKLPDR